MACSSMSAALPYYLNLRPDLTQDGFYKRRPSRANTQDF